MCESRRNCRQEAADELRRPPCPPVWVCKMGPSSAGCFLRLCLSEIASSPCWDSHPFLGELLLAVRKCIFLASLFLLLILITLLPALSSALPLSHLFLVGSPCLLPKCQIENCAGLLFLVITPKFKIFIYFYACQECFT